MLSEMRQAQKDKYLMLSYVETKKISLTDGKNRIMVMRGWKGQVEGGIERSVLMHIKLELVGGISFGHCHQQFLVYFKMAIRDDFGCFNTKK
jgi:hypothetical protein